MWQCRILGVSILLLIPLIPLVNISIRINNKRNLLSENVQNPMEKEFDESRQTFLQEDKERILNKLDNVLSNMKNDPSLGFPVVEPEKGEDKIIRHILLYNRLSPPNSLRTGEFSSKNEFYAWIDQSPGRGCNIELTLGSQKNVKFPDIELLSSRSFEREELNEMQFDELKSEITLKWRGILSVRKMRIDIPVVISYDAREGDDAEFYVKDPIVYKGKNTAFQYEVYAKPKIIRWKVAPAVPVIISINNNKPIRPAIPDGRNRKFKVKFHNNLMNEDEYISLFVAPLIDELEGSPLTYFYGLQLEHFTLFDPFKDLWSNLLEKRGDELQPYFEYERYWPFTLCAHLEVIPADEYQLEQIATTIPEIKHKWDDFRRGAFSVDPFDRGKQKKMKKYVQKYVCDDIEETFCRDENEGGAPSKEQRKNLKCGVFPKSNTLIYKSNENDNTETIRYKIHPKIPEKTPITMIFGYFSGIKEGKTARFNDRFHKPKSFYLPNSFMYVSQSGGNKILHATCSLSAEIDELKCCSVALPLKSFQTENIEEEFDLLVIAASPNIKLLSYPLLLEQTPRLKYRKSRTYIGGILGKTAKFCYKPIAYGSYKIRFEILGPCYALKGCQKLGEQSEDKILSTKNTYDITAPKDFQIPPVLSILVPRFKLKDLKIVPQGSGHGDATQVINNEWFKLRIFFLGKIKGKVVITPKNQRFSFKPESILFNDGDLPFGAIEARAEIDCPSPTRIMIISYQIIDELVMWEIPSSTFLQIAPNPKNIQEVNEVSSQNKNDSILCSIPDDFCMTEGVICGTPKQIGKAIECDKYPSQCDVPIPKPKKDKFKIWVVYTLYTFVGLLIFTILYRNCCGIDGNAMSLLSQSMKDLNTGISQKALPKDAINAQEFMSLAGFDAEEVFSTDNPNPILVAQAELSLQKMLESMKR